MNNPGARNRLCVIRKRKEGKGSAGEPLPGYDEVASMKGQFRTETGLSAIRASAQGSGNIDVPTRYSVRFAYCPAKGIQRGMELVDPNGNVFQVMNVRHDHGGRHWTDVILEEGAVK